ncbi:DUF2812 domain-containing protein [Agromyces sp. LHK192]|uniref:DUF2812 domain-containing protein n=1 Tax=Agromyces sp. LHK192 TaxID=2498704 RepID=UPI000FD90FC5|nr:DUF2812 domain-containing protein [Agromyces sp. LHK192]
MKVLKFFVDFDKEEAWLNRMAADGQLLVGASVRYRFAPIAPGSAVVRVDYRDSMSAADFADYVTLFADAGWRHVAGSRWSGAQYFTSFTGDANADIFSDAASKAQRYRRAMGVTGAILASFALFVFVLGMQGSLAPDQLYLTPGLWEKQGWSFVGAFLFETPFALLRTAPLLMLLACAVLAVQFAYQSVLYRRALRAEPH